MANSDPESGASAVPLGSPTIPKLTELGHTPATRHATTTDKRQQVSISTVQQQLFSRQGRSQDGIASITLNVDGLQQPWSEYEIERFKRSDRAACNNGNGDYCGDVGSTGDESKDGSGIETSRPPGTKSEARGKPNMLLNTHVKPCCDSVAPREVVDVRSSGDAEADCDD
ncbi:hypothetical protein BDW02DRAFT_582427 [Decorospora gaudefroyi]|uniref:Uncharacterized protein n=1 Tax=Decorospora gaudefroyi TaxID=184978 RepID=A0A6A5K0Z6_9PLEO|nr:hypothetical protein BDW02DRAFT_582427 [Decorospora gaudefroyi]